MFILIIRRFKLYYLHTIWYKNYNQDNLSLFSNFHLNYFANIFAILCIFVKCNK